MLLEDAMRHLLPYHCVLWRKSDTQLYRRRVYPPANVDIGVHAGTFHSLTLPDQLPVASILLSGENRTWTIGRWSPIWEPKFAKLW